MKLPIFRILFFGLMLLVSGSVLASDPVARPGFDNIKRFTILHTNDEHAAFLPKPVSEYGYEGAQTRGGIARVATLIQNIRRKKAQYNEQVLVLSAGDYISGSPFSWLVLRNEAPELKLMIESGYDVFTLGNHEFDYGPEILAEYLSVAGYPAQAEKTPIVASNTVIPSGHPLEESGLLSTYIRTLENGLRVGFFGLMGEHAAQVAPQAAPVTFADQHETARNAVQTLREQGADVIVLISHSGENEEAELARNVDGIDIIVGGHTHSVIPQPIREGRTLIVQTGTEFGYVGKLELAYNTESGELTMLNLPQPGTDETYLIRIDDSIAEDPRVVSLVDEYGRKLSAMVSEMTGGRVQSFDQIIARSDVVLTREPSMEEAPLGNFITDAMRFAAERATGQRVDIVFQASGVIRGDLVPGAHPQNPGAVSFYDVASLIGLGSGPDRSPGYPMVSVYLTGKEVRRVLEITVLLSELMGSTYFLQNSGLRVQYDPNRAIWLRVPFKGTPIPSARAILDAQIYRGDGRQSTSAGDFRELRLDDESLYHVVSDHYNASFLPFIGDFVPSLALRMKDEQGNPAEIDDRIINVNGRELKVWAAVVDYLMDQPVGEDGLARVDVSYASTEGRMERVDGPWLLFWPLTAGVITLIVLIFLIVHLRKKRKQD